MFRRVVYIYITKMINSTKEHTWYNVINSMTYSFLVRDLLAAFNNRYLAKIKKERNRYRICIKFNRTTICVKQRRKYDFYQIPYLSFTSAYPH